MLVVCLGRYTKTGCEFFMGLPLHRLGEWSSVVSEVLKRENEGAK